MGLEEKTPVDMNGGRVSCLNKDLKVTREEEGVVCFSWNSGDIRMCSGEMRTLKTRRQKKVNYLSLSTSPLPLEVLKTILQTIVTLSGKII